MSGRLGWSREVVARWRFLGAFAAEIAFYFVLALVPFLIVTFAIASFAIPPDLHVTDQIEKVVAQIMPHGVDLSATELLTHARASASKGWLTFGFLLAAWTSFRFMSACVNALHFIAQDEDEPGPGFWGQSLRAMALQVVWMLALVLTALFFMLAPPVEGFLRGHGLVSVVALKAWAMARSGTILVLLFGAFWLTYGTISLRRVKSRGAIEAAVAAALGWFGLSYAFSHILPAVWRSYHEVYGALGTLIAFLLWAHLNAWVVILAGCWMVRSRPAP